MTFIVLLAIGLAVAHRAMSPAEREQFVHSVMQAAEKAWYRARGAYEDMAPFRALLRARTRLAPVTVSLAALNVTIVVLMRLGPRPLADLDTLVAWGANFGPRTANGEWSRLFSAIFVHASLLQLLVTLVALVPLGLVLERLVGSVAFAGAYLASGLFSSLFNLSVFPLTVSVGAAGAIAGLYGLMLAAATWGLLRRPRLKVPLAVVKWLAVPATVLLGYTVATGDLAAVVVGFLVGVLCGLVLGSRVNVRPTPVVRVAATVVVALFAAIATTVPLRGMSDARAAVQAIVAAEARTSDTYRTAVQKFTAGRMTEKALARVIDRAILPELRSARARLDALGRLPPGQQPLVAAAEEYLELRDESWRVRSQALHDHNMRMLREADEKEAASLDAFRRIG